MKTILINGEKIITIGRYYSKTFENEKHFKSSISQAVMKYKKGKYNFDYQIKKILDVIGYDYIPVYIPTHNGTNNPLLIRYKIIKKLQYGGNRDKKTHFKSIEVIKPPRKVLLIDDVITTGGSITACNELLKKCGSKTKLFSFSYAKYYKTN